MEAVSWVERVRKDFAGSPFLNHVKNLENHIKSSELQLNYQRECTSHQPIHISVNAKNMERFSLDIYKILDERSIFNHNSNHRLTKKSKIKTIDFQLNMPNDYRFHRTSLEIPLLEPGAYLGGYKDGKENRYFVFYVTDYQIVLHKGNRNKFSEEYRLVHRETGESITDESLDFFALKNNKILEKITMKTNHQGVFSNFLK